MYIYKEMKHFILKSKDEKHFLQHTLKLALSYLNFFQ